MEKLKISFKNFFNKLYKNEYIRVFSFIFILGFIFFGTTALGNGLTMSFSGDYELQTLALYTDGYTKIWSFLKTGEFPMYDFSNAFGHDYVAGAAFYYLTSPIYYLLLLFPQKYIFQGIYLLMLLKYAIGGLLFYVLLKKFFGYKDRTCLVGAIAYAFSGWNLYYLWFHFADAMAFFPLLIIGIENCLKKQKGGLITISLVVLACCNYFMFVPFAIFGVFYFIFRWIKIYGVTKRNGYTFWQRWNVAIRGGLCYISGGLLAGIVLIPNLIFAQQSGRVDYDAGLLHQFLSFFVNYEYVGGELIKSEIKSLGEIFSKENLKGLYDYFFIWSENDTNGVQFDATRTKLYIVSNFLFMNSNCWDTTVFHHQSLDNVLGGTFISTPLILLFIPTVINTFKSKKKWDIFTLIFCCIIPFIPFTYYIMHGFSTLYGRWEICLVVLMLIYVLKTFDKIEYINRWMFSLAIVFNVALAGYSVYYSYSTGTLDMQYRILIIIGQLVFMFVVYHLTFVYHKKKWFKDLATGGIILELFVSTIITINMHGVTNYEILYDGSETYNEERVVIDELEENDPSFYRIYNNKATRNYLNLPSALSYNGMSTFNTIYNKYALDFIDRSELCYGGVPTTGALSMSYHEKRPYFDEFVGVKYYIVDKNYLNNDNSNNSMFYEGRTSEIDKQAYSVNVPFGYEKLDTNYENFDVYENKEMIELGFATENYIHDLNVSMNAAIDTPTDYETLYSNMVIIDEVNKDIYGDEYQEKVEEKLANFYKKTHYTNSYTHISNSSLIKHVTVRDDLSEVPRSEGTFKVNTQTDLLNTMQARYGQYGNIMHGRWVEENLFGDEITLTSTKRIAENASVENPANIILNLQMGPQCLVSLYGENDKLLTQDCHQYHRYSMYGAGENKKERSYYVTEEVKKIVIEFINDANLEFTNQGAYFNLNQVNLSYTYFEDFKKDWSYAKEHQLQNIERTLNSFTFESNYESQNIVCLNVPYSDGWTLKMDNEEVDIIVMNGGFIGFIAPSGEHTYYLNYVTPNISSGVAISFIGLGLGLITFVGYNFHYCLAVSKSIFASTILYKKKKDEDDENPFNNDKEEPNNIEQTSNNEEVILENDNSISNKERKEINVSPKTTSRIIRVIISIISILVGLVITNLFKSNAILSVVGLVLGYVLSSFISFFASYFFKLTNLDKKSMIRYLKIMGVGLGIVLMLYLFLSLMEIYITFKFIACIIATIPILYLVYKKILKNYL